MCDVHVVARIRCSRHRATGWFAPPPPPDFLAFEESNGTQTAIRAGADGKPLLQCDGVWSSPGGHLALQSKTLAQRIGTTMIETALSGRTSCCVPYGALGTGKSFTMFNFDRGCLGVLPLTMMALFDRLRREAILADLDDDEAYVPPQVSIAYASLYGDRLHDHYKDGTTAAAAAAAAAAVGSTTGSAGAGLNPMLSKGAAELRSQLTCRVVNTFDEFTAAYEEGRQRIVLLPTKFGFEFARDHTILFVFVSTFNTVGVMSFFDLREFQTTQNDSVHLAPPRPADAAAINKDLSSLSTVLTALSDPSAKTKGTPLVVPWRSTLLTRMLELFFKPGSSVTFLLTLGAEDDDAAQSRATIAFGKVCMRAKAALAPPSMGTLLKSAVRATVLPGDTLTIVGHYLNLASLRAPSLGDLRLFSKPREGHCVTPD